MKKFYIVEEELKEVLNSFGIVDYEYDLIDELLKVNISTSTDYTIYDCLIDAGCDDRDRWI